MRTDVCVDSRLHAFTQSQAERAVKFLNVYAPSLRGKFQLAVNVDGAGDWALLCADEATKNALLRAADFVAKLDAGEKF